MSGERVTKAIVFDVGNVLLRWAPHELVERQFPAVDAAAVAPQIFGPPHWFELDRGTLRRDEVERAAARASGLSVPAIAQLFDAVPPALTPIEPMVELLRVLVEAKVPCYVLSNMPGYIQAEIVARHSFFECFEGRVFSNELKIIKPEPGIYRHLLDGFGLEASACFFIDDTPANLASAETFGFTTAHLPPEADHQTCAEVCEAVWRWLAG